MSFSVNNNPNVLLQMLAMESKWNEYKVALNLDDSISARDFFARATREDISALLEVAKRLKHFTMVSILQSGNSSNSTPIAFTTQASASPSPQASSSSTAVTQEIEDDKGLCIVCFERPRIIAVVPCGHLDFCLACIQQVSICPTCRGPITNFVKVIKS